MCISAIPFFTELIYKVLKLVFLFVRHALRRILVLTSVTIVSHQTLKDIGTANATYPEITGF